MGPSSLQLIYTSSNPDSTTRLRALRVNEAYAVPDVQYPFEDPHHLDRHEFFMAHYYFHPYTLMLHRHPDRSFGVDGRSFRVLALVTVF